MTEGPPTRLKDDPNLPLEVREDLQATQDRPRKYDAVAGLAQFQTTIVASAGAAGAGAVGMSAAKTWGVGLLITAVLGGGVVAVIGSGVLDDDAPTVAPAPETKPGLEPEPELSPAPIPAESQEPEPEQAEVSLDEETLQTTVQPPTESPPTEPSVRREPAAPVDPDELLRLETEHLRELRGLLQSNPRAALRSADDAQRRFARGIFAEERGAIAIFALDRLGRQVELERRAERYLRRYPQGPFSERVRILRDR